MIVNMEALRIVFKFQKPSDFSGSPCTSEEANRLYEWKCVMNLVLCYHIL